ncbi:MAG TPA: RHS repeat-associated core domain-containing protein, partial [Bacteroidia bacterium]|nr:RHS repeat-associated core domain-containing protein [Bacteroidia bacterium]
KTGDDFPTGKEYNEGEYLVLINKSGIDLDLSAYTLRAGNDSLLLRDTLPAGERIILGFGENAAAFAELVALPAEWESAVRMQNTLRLHDRGGIVSVVHQSGAAIDVFSYGDFYGLSAENPYLADSLIDSLGQRSSLKSVQRDAYGGGVSLGGAVAFGEGAVGDIEPGIDPEPTEKAVWGKYALQRGRKVYELKNHLGNVLAVVSDVKIGVDVQQVNVPLVDYYVADVVEMTDYEPFGMQLANRHWVSGDRYRFGFQGQEGDDEWSSSGNMLAFKYRIHDARLGRFLSIDPLAPKYPGNSTYAFAENRVIDGIELEGLEWLFFEAAGIRGDGYYSGVQLLGVLEVMEYQFQTIIPIFHKGELFWKPKVTEKLERVYIFKWNDGKHYLFPTFQSMCKAVSETRYDSDEVPSEHTLEEYERGVQGLTQFTNGLGGLMNNLAATRITSRTPIGTDGNPQMMPKTIYRGSVRWHGTAESYAKDLTLRPGEDFLSFRESLTNPLEYNAVLRPGDPYIAVDVSKLPKGSVVLDGGFPDGKGGTLPPGHISVKAESGVIQKAVITEQKIDVGGKSYSSPQTSGRFPK